MAQIRNTYAKTQAVSLIKKPATIVASAILALVAGIFVARTNSQEHYTLDPSSQNEDSQLALEAPENSSVEKEQEHPQATKQRITVHIDGAVVAPGVYSLEGDDIRVCDICDAAGGLLDDAVTEAINLAAPVADGVKIHIPSESEKEILSGEMASLSYEGGTQVNSLVNINSASFEELQSLSGVGEATARAILEERERGGPFSCIEDIMRVSGIGEKKFERIKDSICV